MHLGISSKSLKHAKIPFTYAVCVHYKQPGLCNKGEQLFHVNNQVHFIRCLRSPFCNILLASTSYVLRDTVQLPLCWQIKRILTRCLHVSIFHNSKTTVIGKLLLKHVLISVISYLIEIKCFLIRIIFFP